MRVRLCIILSIMALLSVGCESITSDVKLLQKSLNGEEEKALEATATISGFLERGSLDSLYLFAENQSNTLFYIYDNSRMVFWSTNWLSMNITRMSGYDKWYYQRFNNAHTICRWTTSGIYTILTVIPIQYSFPFQNKWLQNTFTSPFKVKTDVDIVPLLTDERLAIYSPEGDYMFSLKPHETDKAQEARIPEFVPSFSYQDLFGNGNTLKQKSQTGKWTTFVTLLCLLLFIVMFAWAIFQIIKNKGVRNLSLRNKIMFWFTLLLFVSFLYMGFAATSLIRNRYVEGQKQMLRDKCAYLQVAVKSRVAYVSSLTIRQSRELSIELKELASAYQTDINVYDLSGNLIATSFPEIFDSFLRGRQMAPEPMFRIDIQPDRQHLNEPLIQYEHIGSMRHLAGYIECINWDDIPIGYIGVPFYISENAMQASLDSVMAKIMPAYLVVMLLFIALSFFISRALALPITELGKRLRNLDPTKKNEKLDYDAKDELGYLVASYNKMVDDLNRNVMSLTEKEREAAWQTMARQVAHEINNPLTPMKLTVQQLQRAKIIGGEKFDKYFDKATGTLIDQIDNMSRIAGSFSAFAKNLPDEINLDKVDVAAKLNMAVTMYTNYDNVSVRYIGPESGVIVYADVDQIGRVFTNIIQNAFQAMEQCDEKNNKDIIVMLKPDKEWVEISISDNGPGIPEDLRDKIFLPNFTTKTTGMGLGLAMCKNIVGRSGGEMWFESTIGKGSTFFIKLRMA